MAINVDKNSDNSIYLGNYCVALLKTKLAFFPSFHRVPSYPTFHRPMKTNNLANTRPRSLSNRVFIHREIHIPKLEKNQRRRKRPNNRQNSTMIVPPSVSTDYAHAVSINRQTMISNYPWRPRILRLAQLATYTLRDNIVAKRYY